MSIETLQSFASEISQKSKEVPPSPDIEKEEVKSLEKGAWQRIMEDNIDKFEPEIQKLIIKRKGGFTLTPQEQSRFDKVVNKFWKQEFGAEFNLRNFEKEDYPFKEDVHFHLKKFLRFAEKVNQEIVRQEKLPVVSQQEEKDVAMHTRKKNWHTYWAKRLASEVDILPEPVAQVVKKINAGEIMDKEGQTLFYHYINKRIGVLRFNMEKRLEMAQLKQRLQAIDKQEDYPEKEHKNRKTVFYNEGNHELFIYEDDGKKKVTFGDIVADYEWGIKYRPDKSVPRNIWRKIRKLSDITEARSNIERIFNHEFSYIERVSSPTTALPLDILFKTKMRHVKGIIAERMVTSFLRRVQYNNDLPFQVELANAIEDMELKYDFKVLMPKKKRGVALEGDDMKRDEFIAAKRRIGIQFTVSKHPKTLEKKELQVKEAREKVGKSKYAEYIKKPVDDIVLISLPFKAYTRCFGSWAKKKSSGGPDQYLTDEEKVRVFRAITHNFIDLTDKQIQQLV